MKLKIVKTGQEARKLLMKGADFLADAVKSTLGPHGLNFALEKGGRITNDGVSIAREFEHPDEIVNRGISILREAAIKTNDEAGDGTTTAITLAQAILKEASRQLGDQTKGIRGKKTPSELVRQIEAERKEVEASLISMAEPVLTRQQLIESAKVSVENDELGELIGGTQWDLGPEAIIIAEETAHRESSIELVKGIRIDNGLGMSHVMNNQEKQALEVDETRVILCDAVLQDMKPLSRILDQLNKIGSNKVVLIARAFTPEAIQVCETNIRNGFNLYPINAPYVNSAEIMRDMAAVLGGTFFHTEEQNLEDMQLMDVGFADKVIAKRYEAVFTGHEDEKSKERIAKRVETLEKRLAGEASEFEKRALSGRIAQLSKGFAVVKVGATSDAERKYKKDKADDAVNAVRAALQEGVVPGAGIALNSIAESLPDSYILKRPLSAVYEQIRSSSPKDFTVPEWVKDPVKVIRIALKNACSVAATLATVEGATATERDRPKYVQETANQDQSHDE